jgi:hypothetical protein
MQTQEQLLNISVFVPRQCSDADHNKQAKAQAKMNISEVRALAMGCTQVRLEAVGFR